MSGRDSEVELDVRDRCAIAVMAKASEAGRVKTRLAQTVGAETAAGLNTAFLRDIADNIIRAQDLATISPWMAFAPRGSEGFFKATLPADVRLLETVAPNFGDCLFHTVNALLEFGYQSVCVLNSDSPTLPPAYLVAAAVALAADGDRGVIGPSTDGGYYLLGLKQPHRRLFDDISWSTEHVCRQTLERAAEIGLPMVVLPPWYDVDDAVSLALLRAELATGRAPLAGAGAIGSAAIATRALLAGMPETLQGMTAGLTTRVAG